MDEADLSKTAYARKRLELLELVAELLAIGVDSFDIELPKIAVIGAQSAGKSSLVEAVSGISVPRDSGTCTRCPMECHMRSAPNGQWSCQIYLRIAYDRDGKKLTQRSPDALFGPSLTNKGEVDIWLRRAQMAILNTHISLDVFYSLKEHYAHDEKAQKFSNNIVSITIRDPDSTDLSFIDLPGLVQALDATDITLVRSLVEANIKSESTIILVTIPAGDDMENQEARRLAREADPEGKRTVGIITKPDGITRGATGKRETWREVLSGNKYKLVHGYYCVRLPDDDERQRGITRAQAEQLAMHFFRTQSPWKDLMVTLSNRFGVANFVADISTLLVKVIEEALPKLKETVQKLVADTDVALAALPKPPSGNSVQELLGLVSGFCDELRNVVYGTQQDKRSVQSNRALYRLFKSAIRATRPDFRPFEDHTLFNVPPEDPDSDTEEDVGETPNSKPRALDLWGVRKVIQSSIAWELKNTIPFDAKRTLIKESISLWDRPAMACFDAVFGKFSGTVSKLVHKHFGRYKRLADVIGDFVGTEMSRHQSKARTDLERTLEKNPFYTQNDHYQAVTRAKWLAHYRHVRIYAYLYRIGYQAPSDGESSRAPSPMWSPPRASYVLPRAPALVSGETEEDRALHSLARLGYKNLTLQDLKRLHPLDVFEDELGVMADVRAYFQVAYKRVIDYVPLTIEHSMNQAIAHDLQDSLFARLNLTSDDASERLKELVSEDPEVARRRLELEEKRKRLGVIQQKLNSFSV